MQSAATLIGRSLRVELVQRDRDGVREFEIALSLTADLEDEPKELFEIGIPYSTHLQPIARELDRPPGQLRHTVTPGTRARSTRRVRPARRLRDRCDRTRNERQLAWRAGARKKRDQEGEGVRGRFVDRNPGGRAC